MSLHSNIHGASAAPTGLVELRSKPCGLGHAATIPSADLICAAISGLGSHSQLKVLRHLYREFSMFNCADGINVAADEIELELLREDAALHGERVS